MSEVQMMFIFLFGYLAKCDISYFMFRTVYFVSRAGHAEGAELLTMWLSPMNIDSCAMPYVSHRAHRGRRVANYVVVTDEC